MPLLSLPQELRDSVLLYSLVSQWPSTSRSNVLSEDEFEEPDDLDHKAVIGSDGVYYRRRSEHNTAASLLETCRQLRKDTQAILGRYHKNHGNRYKLEVVLVKEKRLYCTWVQIPPLRPVVDCIEVQLHTQGIPKRNNGFMDEGESTGLTVWRLYSVVERFLRCGALVPKTRSCDLHLQVKEMRIDVLQPDLKHPENEGCTVADSTMSPDRIPLFRQAQKVRVVLNPEALSRFIYVWLEALMRMSDPAYVLPGALQKYGALFIERLGAVTISAEGGTAYVTNPKDYVMAPRTSETRERGIVEHVGMFEG